MPGDEAEAFLLIVWTDARAVLREVVAATLIHALVEGPLTMLVPRAIQRTPNPAPLGGLPPHWLEILLS
jgi:hypothetical protein